jgi:hypothetical protein
VVYKRSPTIARKIFNYKQTVLSIPDNFTELKNECKCHTSRFCDPVHGHVVTGDLRIISNNKLRSLLTKGPKYREKESIRWNKVLQCITQGVLECKKNWAIIENCDVKFLNEWSESLLNSVKQKLMNSKELNALDFRTTLFARRFWIEEMYKWN